MSEITITNYDFVQCFILLLYSVMILCCSYNVMEYEIGVLIKLDLAKADLIGMLIRSKPNTK